MEAMQLLKPDEFGTLGGFKDGFLFFKKIKSLVRLKIKTNSFYIRKL